MQKSIDTGRSSYVEMRSISRLVKRNLGTKFTALNQRLQPSQYSRLSSHLSDLGEGYEFTLTPNGMVRLDNLDQLMSLDSDISIHISLLDSDLSKVDINIIEERISLIEELLEERKKLVQGLKVSSVT